MVKDQTVELTEDKVKSILEIRRGRARLFGEGLFSDPAWDILLELLAAKLGRRRVALADLDAIAPQSVLARWVAELEERQLVSCELDPFRPDQFWIRLSESCASQLTQFLMSARHIARTDGT